jgi:hypothetical protein
VRIANSTDVSERLEQRVLHRVFGVARATTHELTVATRHVLRAGEQAFHGFFASRCGVADERCIFCGPIGGRRSVSGWGFSHDVRKPPQREWHCRQGRKIDAATLAAFDS